MSSADITSPDYSTIELPQLANAITMEHELANKAANTALGHAIECGKMLHAAKSKVPHGFWLKWVEDNSGIPRGTAGLYMHLASNYQRVGNMDSIRSALKLLADDRAEEKRQCSEIYVPFDGEIVGEAPAPAQSAKDARLATTVIDAEVVTPAEEVFYNSANDADDGDGSTDTAPAAPADEPKKGDSIALSMAKDRVRKLDADEIELLLVWVEANKKTLIANYAKRRAKKKKEDAEDAKRWAERKQPKATT